jgi:hypothetical protein
MVQQPEILRCAQNDKQNAFAWPVATSSGGDAQQSEILRCALNDKQNAFAWPVAMFSGGDGSAA